MKWLKVCICLILLGTATLGAVMFFRHAGDGNFVPDRTLYPVAGIDISAHNGEIDFDKVAADSIDFVYIKASEGKTFTDRLFSDNLTRARRAGLKAGPYHFFRFNVSGSDQARHFMAAVGDLPTDLPWAIDVEHWKNDDDYDRSDVIRQLRGMINVLRAAGKRVIIYTNKNGYGHFIDGNFTDVPLWLCSKQSNPPAKAWTFWQYSHTGRVDGIQGHVDRNVFNADTAQWHSWLAGRN